MRQSRTSAAKTAAILLALGSLAAACASTEKPDLAQSEQAAPPPPPPAPPPPQPPPVDVAGKWKLSLAGGSACVLTLAAQPGAADGSVAPAGGCPGNFFTARKWTFEHDRLILRNHKGEVLVELAFADGRFSGQTGNSGAVTLARP